MWSGWGSATADGTGDGPPPRKAVSKVSASYRREELGVGAAQRLKARTNLLKHRSATSSSATSSAQGASASAEEEDRIQIENEEVEPQRML